MLDLYRYRLPFKQPFITGAGTFEYREGVILRYHTSDIDVVSEVAPLPGFSKESLQQAESYLKSIQEQAGSFFSHHFTPGELSLWIEARSNYPSVDFGLSSLGLIVLSIRQKKTVNSILNLTFARSLKINAVIGKSDETKFLSQAKSLINDGFKVLKCKVSADPGHLPRSMKTLTDDYPDISFRLDANRSWPAIRVSELSSRFRNLPVEYIEEPCPTESIEHFDTLAGECVFPVAADETVAELGLQTVINQSKSAPYVIIKPTLQGNLMELFATLQSRNHLEDRVIFTTALESAIGTRMIASAAAMAGSKTTAHGLNTGSLFRQNLAAGNTVENGTFRFQPGPVGSYSFQSINQSLITPIQ